MMDPRKADIFFATASGKAGGPHWAYLQGCIEATHAFPGDKFFPAGLYPHPRRGLYVENNRDALTAAFLASGQAHLLFVDTDIGFGAQHIQMLLDAERDIVSGFYVYQDDARQEFVGKLLDEQDGELRRASVVPGGFLLCTRRAIAQLCAHRSDHIYSVDGIGVVTALWQSTFAPGQPWERDDAAFSRHCLDAGLDMWVHMGCRLVHYGEKAYFGEA